VKKGMEFAAKELEVARADLEFADGSYRVKGTDVSISFQQVARRHTSQLDSLETIPGPMSFPGGAHVAEVEIDPDTGVIDIVNYVAVDDCGRVINHVLLEGQTFGGIVQGIGQVLMEHCVPSPTNLLGAKGAGEAGTTGSIPTLANAVIDALRPLGIHHLDFPYSPARIWQAITHAGS